VPLIFSKVNKRWSPMHETELPTISKSSNDPDSIVQEATLTESELNTLIKISKLVNSSLELNKVIQHVVESAQSVIGAEAGSLFLLDAPRQKLSFYIVRGSCAEKLKDMELDAEEGIVGWVVTHKEAVIVNNVQTDTRFCKRIDTMSEFKTRSILCAPLLIKDRIIGALELMNKKDDNFTLLNLKVCEGIASQAAIAIENAKLYEENLRKERLAAIGQTIAGTAHCVKNILNLVRGGAYIIQQGLIADNVKKVRSGWNIFEKNHGRIEELVLDMLSYAKKRDPELAEHQVAALIDEVCDLADSKNGEDSIITQEYDASLGKAIFDRKAIQRCLLNLVTNALDACDKPVKKIIITTRNREELDCFEITVADNGCGITEEERTHLFEPFYSTKGSKGTGLGLAVTHKIIQEHGGEIKVLSTPNEGTEFTIILPKNPVGAKL
jgi:signal transduction histidine kinase